MKYLLILFFCFFNLYASLAQNSTEYIKALKMMPPMDKIFTQEVNINASSLVKQFFNFNSNSNSINITNPYLVGYTALYKNIGLRLSFGGTIDDSSNVQDSNGSKFIVERSTSDARLGVITKIKLSNKLRLEPAIDVIMHRNKIETINNASGFETKSKETLKTVGFGPSCVLQYYFSKHFAIGTEASIYYSKGNLSDYVSSSFQAPFTASGEIKKLTMTMPASIFAFIIF